MKQNHILRAAVAGCFSLAAGQALAVVNISGTTATGVTKFAKEIPSNTTTLVNAGNALDLKVAVPTGYVPTSANPLFVKLNLTNGARFVANPTLLCGTAAAAGGVSGSLTLGGTTTSFAVFQLESGAAVLSGTCSAGMGNMTISGLNTVSVSATQEYKNGLTNVVSGNSNSYITFVRGVSANINSADGNVVVDATSGSDAFTTTSNRGVTSLATLGTVSFGATNLTAADAAGVQTSAGSVSAASVLTTASITVNGPAIAAALAANGNSGMFLDAAASACTTKSYTVSASATNSVTFNNVALADLSAGVNVCINVSGGTTVITTGQFTASVGGVAVTNVTVDFSAGSDKMETVTANGTVKNAYMINASTSAAKTSVLRIINTGVVAATFTASAFAVDVGVADGVPVTGSTLGASNSVLGAIAAGGSLSLTSAQIEQKLGFTPSSGFSKYRLVISAGTDAMTVLNFTRDIATGAITLTQSQTD